MKECTKCRELKSINSFYKRSIIRGGYNSECKSCARKIMNDYRKTKIGVAKRIYDSQIAGSKKRNHILPTYSKEEFIDFALSSPDFHLLYDNWVMSDYNKWLKPSFDRDNDYKGYSFDNFNKWMTWEDNAKKAHKDRKSGINNKHSKKVIAIHLITGKKSIFHSAREAERKTGAWMSNISACCLGKYRHKTTAGYQWEYSL